MVTQDTKITRAKILRTDGYSYSEISKRVRMSKRDLLKVCKNIKFSKKGFERYYNKVKGIKRLIKKQKNKLDRRKARIIGHLIFDGFLFKTNYHYCIGYVNSSKELINQFIKDMYYIYRIKPSAIIKEKGKNVYFYRVRYNSKNLYEDLIKYTPSYSTASKSIKIPLQIKQASLDIRKEFIKAFWEDEGSVSLVSRKVNGDLKSYEIITWIGELLKKLGLKYNIINYNQKGGIYYKIYLSIRKENLKLFKSYNLFELSRICKGRYIGYKKSEMLGKLINLVSKG